MSRKKRFIKSLSETDIRALTKEYKSGKSHTYRCRCKAVLLSNEGWSCRDLSTFFDVTYGTVHSWLNRWDSGGIKGLADKPGRGRKSVLKLDDHIEFIDQVIDASPSNLNKALATIESQLGLSMSKRTLQRFLKKVTDDGSDIDEPLIEK